MSAYAQAWNELYEEKIDKIGVLWLKSSKHGEDKKGKKIQGKGWEIYEPEKSVKENLKLFEHIHELYKLEHPDPKPTAEQFPTEVQIDPGIKYIYNGLGLTKSFIYIYGMVKLI